MGEVARTDFNVFVGAQSGILKGVNVNATQIIGKNLNRIKQVDHSLEILCLEWADDAEAELVLGLRSGMIRFFNRDMNAFTDSIDTGTLFGKLVGIGRYGEHIVTATNAGYICLWKRNEPDFEDVLIELELKRGTICRMRQSPHVLDQVAVAGKASNLRVFDMNRPDTPIFVGKNAKPNQLGVVPPIWITDITFVEPSVLAVCTKHHKVRVYDVRGQQRRPVIDLPVEESPLNVMVVAPSPGQVIVGSAMGRISRVDFRKKGIVRHYKNVVGSVRGLECHAQSSTIASVGLDRFLYVHDVESGRILYRVYLKSQLNCIKVCKGFNPTLLTKREVPEEESDSDDAAGTEYKKHKHQ